jgi:O-Antigen ligase
MGLFFTLFYILTSYLGAEKVFGPLVEYHIEVIVALVALIASLPSLQDSELFRLAQSYAVVGMCIAVLISFIVNGLGASLSIGAFLNFLPNSFTFFLIVLNCKKKRHLQMVILVLLFVSLFTIYNGYSALRAENFLSPYLIGQENDTGSAIHRVRGLAFINDPNDFAQLMVSLIPCLFFFWRPRNILLNLPFVLVPAGLLLFGMYLTHSRGGMIAFLAVAIIAGRRKIGTVPSLILAGGLFALTTVIGWSGGREVSVEAGAGRMGAWAAGLDLLRTHPIFGVGYQQFAEHYEITAHNTVVVCAAELGLFGLFSWLMFVVPTVRDAVTIGIVGKSKEQLAKEEEDKTPFERSLVTRASTTAAMQNESSIAEPSRERLAYNAVASPYFADPREDTATLPEEELRRLARLLVISLLGYFVAGWFLSRAYAMTLFIYGGMVEAVYRMALDQGIVPPRLSLLGTMRLSAVAVVGLLIVVYIMLRVHNLMPN